MPRLVPFRLAPRARWLSCSLLSTAAVAVAKGPLADLRVVGSGGKVLAEESLGAGRRSVKTSPKATCFGAGTGGSGKSVQVKGADGAGPAGAGGEVRPPR